MVQSELQPGSRGETSPHVEPIVDKNDVVADRFGLHIQRKSWDADGSMTW